MGNSVVEIPVGASTLSLRTGAPVIPCGVVRNTNATFIGVIGEAVEFEPSGKISQDIIGYTQKIVTELETLLKPYMDQWYVFHPLFNSEQKSDLEDPLSAAVFLSAD